MTQRLPAFALLSILLLVASCARPPGPVERPVPVPFDTASSKARSDYWRDCRAKFRLKVESEKTKFNTSAIALFKGRNFARFETFGPVGQTVSLFVLNETGPALFIPSEKMVVRAARPETLIYRFLGVSIPFEVFRHALSASIPPELLDGLDTRLEKGILHAVKTDGKRVYDWRFNPEGTTLKGMHARDNEFEADIVYDPPVLLSPEATPQKILISSEGWTMQVAMGEIVPLGEFHPSAFYLPQLPAVREVDLDK